MITVVYISRIYNSSDIMYLLLLSVIYSKRRAKFIHFGFNSARTVDQHSNL